MKLEVGPDYTIKLKEVYSGVLLETEDKETMGICMRDSGFEFNYNGTWYSAQKGIIKKMESDSKNHKTETACSEI
jgi:hypothetical protein